MPLKTDTDRRQLARAIELAEQGRGRVSPNPLVGAVIGRDDEHVGEGFHRALGGPHAEVEAIEAAGDRDLSGATMYVSLEPCCHHGRTPPCTDAIRDAGIARVVIASDDPSEHASGRGLGILRDDGVEVVMADGELAARARLLNQPFRKHARTGRPWVLFKSAMSLDGKVATAQRRLEVDLERGEPLPRPSLARRVRCRGGRDRDRAGRRPAADGARQGRRAPAAPDRLRFARAPAARLEAGPRRAPDRR